MANNNTEFLFVKNETESFEKYKYIKDNPVTLYFELLLENTNATCVEYSKYSKYSKYIKLTWENLNGLGTPEQKISINKFRLAYVENLKSKIDCNSNNVCKSAPYYKLEGVGTTTNISAASDIDMNFYFDFNKKNANDIIVSIEALYAQINNFHYDQFKTPYEDLFDINIYATNLYSKECNNTTTKCAIKKIKNCSQKESICKIENYDICEQRKWSFYRAAEIIQKHKLTIPSNLKKLYNDTLIFITENQKTNTNLKKYVNNVKTSFEFLNKNDSKTIDLNAFSKAKVNERETYRSAGAFLHIVGGRNDLDHNLYIDSLLQLSLNCFAT